MTAVESRRFPRYSAELPAWIGMPTHHRAALPSTVREIGRGGCLLCAQVRYEKGRILPFRLALGDASLFVVGRVLYQRTGDGPDHQHGVEFIDLLPDDRVLLDRYLGTLGPPQTRH